MGIPEYETGDDGLRTILRELREQKRTAEEEFAAASARISELRKTIFWLDQTIAPLVRLCSNGETNNDSIKSQKSPARADYIEMLMKQEDRQWQIIDLVNRLEAMGCPLPSKRSAKYLAVHSALKQRTKKFRKVSRGQWILIGSETDRANC